MTDTNIRTERAQIAVEGMDCASCAAGIERALRKAGVADASVNFATQIAYFTPTPQFTPPQVVSEITKLGYSAKQISSRDEYRVGSEESHKAADRTLLINTVISLGLSLPLILHMFVSWHWLHSGWVQLAISTPVVILGLRHFGRSAIGSLRAGLPNMDVLICIGVLASYLYSLAGLLLQLGGNYLFFESAAVIIALVFTGNLLESRAVNKASSAIRELSKAQVTTARRVTFRNGHEESVTIQANEIVKGDLLRVNSGDKIPTDSKIEQGELLIDESLVTGESAPVTRFSGQTVIGGSTVHSGSAILIATEVGEHTVLSGIVRLVEQAQGDKPPIQRLGDIVSAYFTPVVIVIALATFIGWIAIADLPTRDALLRAVAVLVIACPCAMGLATPMAVMVGIGRGARNGILIRGGSALQRLATIKHVIFDKTGTLTTGDFSLQGIEVHGISEEKARSIIHGIELHSSHPIARCLVRELSGTPPQSFDTVHEKKGAGLIATTKEGTVYTLGTPKLGALAETHDMDGRIILTEAGRVVAKIQISDSIKPEAKKTIQAIKELGLIPILVSGDSQTKCAVVAEQLGITEFYSQHTPEDKLRVVEAIQTRGSAAFVGDGVNDAPALAKATVGVAMSTGTDLAIESADVVLLQGSLPRLIECISLSRATLRTIKQNLFWAFSYNIFAIPIAAFGYLTPIVSALAMAFSDVMTIGNSLRLRSKTLRSQ